MNLNTRLIPILCVFLTGFGHPTHITPIRVDVEESSEYLGKTYTTRTHMAYELNLPRVDEVAQRIALTSSVLIAHEVDRKIVEIKNSCGGCLSKDRLTTARRIQSIPHGTKMTVVDEYIYHTDYGAMIHGPTNIHSLIVEDQHGNFSEIAEIFFESFFVDEHTLTKKPDRRESWLLYNMSEFEKNDELILNYCPSRRVKGVEDPQGFIADFQLEHEVIIWPNTYACKAGTTIKFLTLEAYLTANYYFSDWQLYGRFNSYCDVCPTEWLPLPNNQ